MTDSTPASASLARVGRVVGLFRVEVAMPHGGESQARGFYIGLLGMIEVPKPAHLAVSGGCWFEGGGARIHLGVEQHFFPARKAHPALLVDDLDAIVERLKQAGVGFTDGRALEGYRRGDVYDPFGNRIELLQPLGGEVAPG